MIMGTIDNNEALTTEAVANLVVSKLRDVNHALVAPRHNAVAFRAVVACPATVANNVDLGLIVQAKV